MTDNNMENIEQESMKKIIMDIKPEIVSIDLIKPYWRNPRRNDSAVEAVKESIKRFGYNSPISVDMDGVIIAGHTRYKAMKELGATHIAVVKLDLSHEEASKYRIIDNRTGELAEWDKFKLSDEFRDMATVEDLGAYFDTEMISEMLQTASLEDRNITQYDIEQEEKRLNEIYEINSEDAQDDYIEIPCIHCGEVIILSRSELRRLTQK